MLTGYRGTLELKLGPWERLLALLLKPDLALEWLQRCHKLEQGQQRVRELYLPQAGGDGECKSLPGII